MANLKSIYITGYIPFDIHETDSGKTLLAYLASPVSGIRISYGEPKLVPNNEIYKRRKDKTPTLLELGPSSSGQTALFPFVIEGGDSLSWDYIDKMVLTILENGGEININRCVDPQDK